MKKIKGKTELIWDENERKDYLTGFQKRKTERRKHGIAMQLLKDQKAKKEAVKERRAIVEQATHIKLVDIDDDDDEVDEDEEENSDNSGDDEDGNNDEYEREEREAI